MNDDFRPALLRLNELQPSLPAWKQETVNRTIEAAASYATARLKAAEAGLPVPTM